MLSHALKLLFFPNHGCVNVFKHCTMRRGWQFGVLKIFPSISANNIFQLLLILNPVKPFIVAVLKRLTKKNSTETLDRTKWNELLPLQACGVQHPIVNQVRGRWCVFGGDILKVLLSQSCVSNNHVNPRTAVGKFGTHSR